MAKKPKLGKLISSEPLDDSFEDIKEEARVLIFEKEQRPKMFIHNDVVTKDASGNMLRGKFILYQESGETPFKMAYECACGNSDSAVVEFEGPYTIRCSSCDELVYLQEKAKGKGVPKK
ncbi:MAG: hypothetical protein ABIG20_03870 [archaeon]